MDEVFQLLDYLGIQSQSTIQTYARLAHRRHLKKGEHLYHGGEDSTNLYFLISGILRGFTVSAGGKEYTECILHKYGHAHIGMIGMDNRQEFKLNKNLEALTEADLIYFDVRPIIKITKHEGGCSCDWDEDERNLRKLKKLTEIKISARTRRGASRQRFFVHCGKI